MNEVYHGNVNDDDACIVMDAMDDLNAESASPTLVCTVVHDESTTQQKVHILKVRR